MINFRDIRTLEGGYSTDLTNNVEKRNTYQKGFAGRLYSKDGVLSFSGGAGTKLIYKNNEIVKYLGYYSFKDEIIVFAKCLKSVSVGGTTKQICNTVLTADSFDLENNADNNVPLTVSTEILDNTDITEDCYNVTLPPENPSDFEINFSCENSSSVEDEIDYDSYFKENNNVANRGVCSINEDEIPINNIDYNDCILSLKEDDSFNLYGTVLWVGAQNWPINGKITCEGVDENEFYKRVYYTDAVNPKRVVNTKDSSLAYRKAKEFNQVLNNVLLQPEIVEITDGGRLKAMKSLYVYRIVSENGQVSEFSPASDFAKILVETEPVLYRGGDVSELTGKAVKVRCNIINAESTSQIECIALEYEAFGPPTAIRNLGKKNASSVVEFDHFGNESEFADNITYNDIIDFKNSWSYCNDFTSKKNKLIAAGLRNEPLPTEINNLEYLFPLHGWNEVGDTHNCLINPEPWNYNMMDPTNTEKLIYIKQKVYRTISSFGPLTLKLKNIDVVNEIEITFPSLTLESYTNINNLVITWLLDQKANNPNFNVFFPNLDIVNAQGQLLFTPIDENINTDMANYVFESNNGQFIENFDNDIVFLPVNIVDLNNLIFGAKSIGFDQGTGIRISYREIKVPLLNQAQAVYDGTGKLLDFEKPSKEKFFMKDEIYRLGLQAYNNDSTRFFTIPLGDVHIPGFGRFRREMDDAGNVFYSSEKYTNQSVENGILYGHGIKMHVEVRLSCELQKLIPMYQLVYVERNEDNRTILCQGIAAPLERVQDSGSSSHRMPDPIRNKWNLPYYGGPTYEKKAFENYDTYGENDQYTGQSETRRVYAHRGLMYFDSPDLYTNKISDQYVKTSQINILGKLNTDHTPEVIRERGGIQQGFFGFTFSYGDEIYPKFSRKILEQQIEGDNHSDNLPALNVDERETGTHLAHFINVSVYAKYTPWLASHEIEDSVSLNRGEVISGSSLNLDNDISNNACCLATQPWYYSGYARIWQFQDGRPNSTLFKTAMTSPGYKTVMIKTQDDLFTENFLGTTLPLINTYARLGGSTYSESYDTIPLINIYKKNRESVFGGRSIEAYSKNTYIPLSKTIPTLKSSTSAQIFDVGADINITLNIRLKNDFGDDEVFFGEFNNHGGARDKGEIDTWTRNGAWCYAVVLESQVEPKDMYQYEFYRENGTHNFDIDRGEIINEAYFNENNLKSYIPKPFNFKDDPNQGHVIAVSDVKLAGEYFDSWTVFKPNNFYAELEKNKGDILNLIKENEEIFAIQEQQTSLIYIGTDRIITDQQGSPINLQQGSGTVVDGHKILSNYGTSIRRAVVSSDYGFVFFDERKVEFVKRAEGLLAKKLLHLEYFNKHKQDPIIDTEPYFDQENKETCVRIRTKNGNNYTLSFNEAMGVFNGEFPFDNDIYMMFDEKVYSPITTVNGNDILSENLHQLNEGNILNFFGVQTNMVLGVYINANLDKVFQYKQVGIVTNISYPINSVFGKSNLGYDRTILGTHEWYKIREGIHTVPLVNESNDPEEYKDVRGNWVYIEINVSSLNQNKVDILAVLNDLRYSHQ